MKGLLGTFIFLLSLSFSYLDWTFFHNADSLDAPTPVYPYPRIVLVGPTGVGKSSLANVLAGCLPNNNSCFKTCPGGDSCTAETTVNVVTYLGDDNYGSVTIVDSPGFGDSNGAGDGPIIANMIEILKHTLGDANLILLCQEFGRFQPGIQQMIVELEALFGRDRIWKNVVLEMTKWSFSQDAILKRNISGVTEESALQDINEHLMSISHLNESLPGVFIDSYAPMFPNDQYQQLQYQRYTQELWEMALKMPKIEFFTIEDILEELSECRNTNDCLTEVLEGRLTQVETDVIQVKKTADHNSDDISTLETNIMLNKGDIATNSDAITTNSEEIIHHQDQIYNNDKTIQENSDYILQNSVDISHNFAAISVNSDTNKANTAKISINTRAIEDLQEEQPTVVGICGYNSVIEGTGTLTYSHLYTSVATDGSYLSTNTGKYKAVTGGLYTITWSTEQRDLTIIWLLLDNVQQDDSRYGSDLKDAGAEMGSRTTMVCLRPGQEVHLMATTNDHITHLQFCIQLVQEYVC